MVCAFGKYVAPWCRGAGLALASLFAVACQQVPESTIATIDNTYDRLNADGRQINPTRTATGPMALCVAGLIEYAGLKPKLLFHLEDVRDRTIPFGTLQPSRFSDGATFWFYQLTEDLGPRISVVYDPYQRSRSLEIQPQPDQYLVRLSGGTTEDNRVAGAQAAKIAAGLGVVDIRIGNDKSYDAVTVDLAYSVNNQGMVSGAASATVLVERRSGEADVFVADTDAGIGFAGTAVRVADNGLHRGQRIAFEFAALSIIAEAYSVDLARCMGTPKDVREEAYEKWLEYRATSGPERIQRMQYFLKLEGFYKGRIDGLWGPLSRAAIAEFRRSLGHAQAVDFREIDYIVLALRYDARDNEEDLPVFPADEVLQYREYDLEVERRLREERLEQERQQRRDDEGGDEDLAE